MLFAGVGFRSQSEGRAVMAVDEARETTPREWEPMQLAYVGNVSAVMQKKSGPHFDPSPVHTVKRGNGP
jgi:hypothetical protein